MPDVATLTRWKQGRTGYKTKEVTPLFNGQVYRLRVLLSTSYMLDTDMTPHAPSKCRRHLNEH